MHIKALFTHMLLLTAPASVYLACSAAGTDSANRKPGRPDSSAAGGPSTPAIGFDGGFNPGPIQSGEDVPTPSCSENCDDFPSEPIFEDGAPANAAELFGAPDNFTPGGCVLEPQLSTDATPGALIPANWLRPRFRFAANADLFEFRITAPAEAHALIVYTNSNTWTMPAEMWAKVGPNNAGTALTVTIRALSSAQPGSPIGMRGDLNIAPVNAGGSMVFWSVNDSNVTTESSKLFGFSVGEEGVIETLAPKKVAFSNVLHEGGVDLRGEYGGGKPGFAPGQVQCIGCHTSTPDGAAVVFTDDWPWNKAIASVEKEKVGQTPDYISVGARTLLKMPWLGTQSMSPGHWTPGDRLLVASYGSRTKPFDGSSKQKDRLLWIDLETPAPINDDVPAVSSGMRQGAADARDNAIAAAQGSAWGTFAMEGETLSAVTPDFNNKGDKIVYVSTDSSPNGHPSYDAMVADIRVLPFNERKGGTVMSLAGAATPENYEYYPSYSPDDKLIAFAQAPKKGTNPDGPYYNRLGQIHVISSDGGTPVRLLANEPVACAGDNMAAGLINSWPKWSPKAVAVGGKHYYFLIFSSARKYDKQFEIPKGQHTPASLDARSSQLYMAGIAVDDSTGEVTTYPAVYLWNQNRLVVDGKVSELDKASNLTPAWDDFKIPPVVIVK